MRGIDTMTAAFAGRPSDACEADEAAFAAAADDLATRLTNLADELVTILVPERVGYGHGRPGGLVKQKSPAGFVVAEGWRTQMVLSDGRLWEYSRNGGFPAPRYFDPRTDYVRFVGGRSFFGGQSFRFLGAELGCYAFGLLGGQEPGLGALCSGGKLRYVSPDEAFADIAAAVVARSKGRRRPRGGR